jgi:hypothetical protein
LQIVVDVAENSNIACDLEERRLALKPLHRVGE